MEGDSSPNSLVGPPGPPGRVPKVSFSAALTTWHVNTGTIIFDKELVNDGNFYNPNTGQ